MAFKDTCSLDNLSKNTIVRIVNPPMGGKDYTNGRSALHHIRRGAAVLTNDGRLYFLTRAQVIEDRERENLDRAIAQYRSGIVLWNGSSKDPLAQRRPGEVRS